MTRSGRARLSPNALHASNFDRPHVDLAQWAISALFDGCNMKSTDGPRPDEKELPLKPMRTEEALRIIEEYANELRAIIKKLRDRLN
ncbi:hypothetical protein Q2941_06555 [Bradyrhizobium sp. UFLA05-153]|uniref:hypothetical protein n=1 Tax=Bradyrhizobium sp. Ec3.3 TaxID=189753 RepID=UPI0012EB4DFA|nr:hypothetical protein [Bradyrhizobium sp. Ec3.3]